MRLSKQKRNINPIYLLNELVIFFPVELFLISNVRNNSNTIIKELVINSLDEDTPLVNPKSNTKLIITSKEIVIYSGLNFLIIYKIHSSLF